MAIDPISGKASVNSGKAKILYYIKGTEPTLNKESLDTIIPTPDGDKTMEDIQIGDYVFDNYGVPVKVINTSPIFTNHDCYEITFSD